MNIPWGTLINAALDQGLGPEDALLAVIGAAHTIEEMSALPDPPVDVLTPRERETLTVLADDPDFNVAAARMGVSMHTIRANTRFARRKLGVRKTRDAVEIVRRAA